MQDVPEVKVNFCCGPGQILQVVQSRAGLWLTECEEERGRGAVDQVLTIDARRYGCSERGS